MTSGLTIVLLEKEYNFVVKMFIKSLAVQNS